ncbi:shikimate kinase [Cyanobium sp. WAJ14-Wanaka]|uniref:shikimate kinase n=1 Tax=Cyanobium sp. WAJ14-Wanaka TaxID=2823725 RepID=UPI0020CE931F|nr:shikimate kinase [Cyanobium sp. WAJ14-Wanaka]MCP9775292.1 shikimate kinase [Cyanobium sp. WAJ14-Wanaka]
MTAAPYSSLAKRLAGLNLYLVGMMGTGKSAVGRPLATALSYRFIDADSTLERAAGRTIAEIFASDGESDFRQLETGVLNQIASWHSLVVATGGGVVTRPENWGHLRQGVVIWLDASAERLLERIQQDPTPRPLMQSPDPGARLRELIAQRQALYAQADLVIRQRDETPQEVAEAVLTALPTILKARDEAPQQPAVLRNGDGELTQSLN